MFGSTRGTVNDPDLVLDLLNSKVPTNLLSLDITVVNYEAVKEF